MINYPPTLKAIGGARTGIAPANLLDVLTLNGDLYLFSDRLMSDVPTAIIPAASSPGLPPNPPVPVPPGQAVIYIGPGAVSALRQDPGYGGTATASASPSGGGSGNLTLAFGGSFESGIGFTLDTFTASAVPAGAVIHDVYAMARFSPPIANDLSSDGGFGAALVDGDGFSYYRRGGALSDITGASFAFDMQYTLTPPGGGIFIGPLGVTSIMNVSGLFLAVYYSLPGSPGSPGEPEIPGSGIPPAVYLPWLMSVPQIAFHRSLQTDFGSFILQNVSGDTLSRDFEKLMRRATLEGAFFIYRLWQADAEASWLEVHGTLTVEDVGVDTVKLKGVQLLNPAQEDTPPFQYSETCQLQYGGRRCGATGSTECKYSYQTCQVPERIFAILNNYEKNYGESLANIAIKTINRRRKI